jgi:glutamyl-tRNA synthetase
LADISAPHGGSPVYPGFCRGQSPRWGVEQGRLPSWRLAVQPGLLCWTERLAARGQRDATTEVGDVVLRRADGYLAYHLATAVDELSLGITDVVRGSDLWCSTAPQVAVMQRLGGAVPVYWHVPLWCDGQGQRLSKREGGLGLQSLREQGMEAAAVVGLLASSLNLVPAGSRLSANELRQHLDLAGLEGCLQALAPGASEGPKA